MAAHLLCYEVGDLCLGKPALRSISASCTISEALVEIKACEGNYVSIWSCDYNNQSNIISNTLMNDEVKECICIGKLCMVDIICYLCKEDNFCSPSLALKAPVSSLLLKLTCLVKHVEPSTSLLEAIDIMLQGAHNIVVPIKSKFSRRKQLQKSSSCTQTNHNGIEFCWLTQEDVIRFLLSSIGFFSPIPTLSIEDLDIITTDILAIGYNSLASSAIEAISRSLSSQTSVAVVDDCRTLIGEISPSTLACVDETISAAIMTLSAGDLIGYIDCGSPPEEIMNVVKSRLKEMNLEGILEEFEVGASSFSSSDEELPSPKTTLISPKAVGRHSRSSSYSARMLRTAEAIVCHPWSSLVAVMIQAIAHRINYVWVIEEDYSVVGIVTFASILGVLRDHFESLL